MKTRLFNALRNTVFTAALIHLTIEGIYATTHHHYEYFNVAKILDLQLFTNIQFNTTTGLISAAGTLAVLCFYYWLAGRKDA